MPLATKISALVSPEVKASIASAVSRGYKQATVLRDSDPALSTLVGYGQLPYIRRACIDYNLSLIPNTHSEFEAVNVPNANGNTYFVCLKRDELRMTAHYVEKKGRLARQAVFRSMMASANYDLFDDDQDLQCLAMGYAEIVHSGKNEPESVCLLVPDATCSYPAYSESLEIPMDSYESAPVEQIPDDLAVSIAHTLGRNHSEAGKS